MFFFVLGVVNNCLYKFLRRYLLYEEVEFIWSGSMVEGVNILNFESGGCGKFCLEFEMDILCVFWDIKVGRLVDSFVILMK